MYNYQNQFNKGNAPASFYGPEGVGKLAMHQAVARNPTFDTEPQYGAEVSASQTRYYQAAVQEIDSYNFEQLVNMSKAILQRSENPIVNELLTKGSSSQNQNMLKNGIKEWLEEIARTGSIQVNFGLLKRDAGFYKDPWNIAQTPYEKLKGQ